MIKFELFRNWHHYRQKKSIKLNQYKQLLSMHGSISIEGHGISILQIPNMIMSQQTRFAKMN